MDETTLLATECWLCGEPVPVGTPAVQTPRGHRLHLECVARVATMEAPMRDRYLRALTARRDPRNREVGRER